MSNHVEFYPGARFYKADLHIHTPASKCWEGKRDAGTMGRIFDNLVREGVEVVSITDHNTVASIETAKKLGKKHGIVVFPGVEISTKEGHVIAIFDPQESAKEIENWLATIGFVGKKLGSKDSLAEDMNGDQLGIAKVFSLIEYKGGVAIAPHPNSKNIGFMQVMKQKGLAKQVAYLSPYLRGLELGGNRESILNLAAGRVKGYEKKYACLETSDSHAIADIGKRYTYLKMGHMGINALKQVLYDPEMRIRYRDAYPPPSHAWIKSLEVSQGFFEGIDFRFHPDMNCLVGGKAVGKSLVIELIRFALGVQSAIPDTKEHSRKMITARTCLGEGGTVTLHVVTENGEEYRIQRTSSDLDEGPEVFYEDTPTVATERVEELFNTQIYSQNEIIRLGENLPALVEWLDGFLDLESETTEIEGIKRQIDSVLEDIDANYAIAGNLDDLEKKKESLEGKRKLLEEKAGEEILRTYPNWQQEKRVLDQTLGGLEQLIEEVIEPLEEVEIEEYLPLPEKKTPNYKAICKQREELLELRRSFVKAGEELRKSIAERTQVFKKFTDGWEKGFKLAQKRYKDVILSAGVKNAAAVSSELNKAIQEIEKIEKKLKRSRMAEKKLEQLEDDVIHRLVPKYVDCHSRIFKKRLDKASEISELLNSAVRIKVLQMDDRDSYSQVLEKAARGSSLRKEQRQQIVSDLTPSQLGQLIRYDDAETLSEKTGLSKSKAQVFIDNVWDKSLSQEDEYQPSQIYEIMLVELKDTVTVELKLSDGTYKPMPELSGGSKCTAILSVALVEGSCPLVVDQPEDALDNPFVFERIVKTVRKTKANRQYIFATHNSNVAVASDAELIYCLRATATEGEIDKHGSIDEISTRDKVVANLEGGSDAFSLRRQKYDIHVTDPNAVVLDAE